MKLTGETTWTGYVGEKEIVQDSGKVTEANVIKDVINFTFIQDGKEHYASLKSKDDFNYTGEYALKGMPHGKAEFRLYKNKNEDEYLLFGSYDGHTAEEGHGRWWVELKKDPVPK